MLNSICPKAYIVSPWSASVNMKTFRPIRFSTQRQRKVIKPHPLTVQAIQFGILQQYFFLKQQDSEKKANSIFIRCLGSKTCKRKWEYKLKRWFQYNCGFHEHTMMIKLIFKTLGTIEFASRIVQESKTCADVFLKLLKKTNQKA